MTEYEEVMITEHDVRLAYVKFQRALAVDRRHRMPRLTANEHRHIKSTESAYHKAVQAYSAEYGVSPPNYRLDALKHNMDPLEHAERLVGSGIGRF